MTAKEKKEKTVRLWHPVHGVKSVVKSRVKAHLDAEFVLASSRGSLSKKKR